MTRAGIVQGPAMLGLLILHWPTGRELLSLMVLTHELLFILSRYPDSRMTGLPSVIQHSHVAAWARLTVSLLHGSIRQRPAIRYSVV